jgi:hypothetical protein
MARGRIGWPTWLRLRDSKCGALIDESGPTRRRCATETDTACTSPPPAARCTSTSGRATASFIRRRGARAGGALCQRGLTITTSELTAADQAPSRGRGPCIVASANAALMDNDAPDEALASLEFHAELSSAGTVGGRYLVRVTDGGRGQEIWMETPFQIASETHDLLFLPNVPPGVYERYAARARLAEQVSLETASPRIAFVAVRRVGDDWPFLVVAQTYTAHAVSNDCGVVLLPTTRRVFLAAGEVLLAYDIEAEQPRRLWQDTAEHGFWHWRVHGDVVLMAAEVGFAAWDTYANKLWSTCVEPPWSYEIEGQTVTLDVMGAISRFPLHDGPPSPAARS